jgi:sodium/potassium-transporting ATPase subunit alpha
MKIQQLSIADTLKTLRTSQQGLSSSEAQHRLMEFGPNLVEALQREHSLVRLLKQFFSLFSIILWVAAGLAFFAEWSAPGQGMKKLAFAIVAVILISGVFSFWQERRAEQTLAALQALIWVLTR